MADGLSAGSPVKPFTRRVCLKMANTRSYLFEISIHAWAGPRSTCQRLRLMARSPATAFRAGARIGNECRKHVRSASEPMPCDRIHPGAS